MKILLSAYACEPNRGSEPGVGWNWAIELARLGHQVWVLTRANNRPVIESEILRRPQPANLHFYYYDLPAWARWWKKGGRGVHIYYLLWQWGAYLFAREKHTEINFDLVHHVTFVSVRQPSFMGRLQIPFVFGPVAGGDSAPLRLRLGYPMRGMLLDGIRDLANFCVPFDPFMRVTFRQASRIYVTSLQTKALVPKKYHEKTRMRLAIGLDEKWHTAQPEVARKDADGNDRFRVLYVGHFLYLKGMHLGLPAFAELARQHPEVRLTMVGKGPEEKAWKKLVHRLGIAEKVEWSPWLAQEALPNLYLHHDLFLFPSLHDSGGMVVLEAMAHGLPVVCFDLGGPGELVDNTCGAKVEAFLSTQRQAVQDLAKVLGNIHDQHGLLQKLSSGAMRRAEDFKWRNLVDTVYNS